LFYNYTNEKNDNKDIIFVTTVLNNESNCETLMSTCNVLNNAYIFYSIFVNSLSLEKQLLLLKKELPLFQIF